MAAGAMKATARLVWRTPLPSRVAMGCRGEEASPGSRPRRAPSRLSSVAGVSDELLARYSGGAAPALNRFPCPQPAIELYASAATGSLATLGTTSLLRRKNVIGSAARAQPGLSA